MKTNKYEKENNTHTHSKKQLTRSLARMLWRFCSRLESLQLQSRVEYCRYGDSVSKRRNLLEYLKETEKQILLMIHTHTHDTKNVYKHERLRSISSKEHRECKEQLFFAFVSFQSYRSTALCRRRYMYFIKKVISFMCCFIIFF